jgi:ABC-type branched-subunit amino acid transport system permease subunit
LNNVGLVTNSVEIAALSLLGGGGNDVWNFLTGTVIGAVVGSVITAIITMVLFPFLSNEHADQRLRFLYLIVLIGQDFKS